MPANAPAAKCGINKEHGLENPAAEGVQQSEQGSWSLGALRIRLALEPRLIKPYGSLKPRSQVSGQAQFSPQIRRQSG